MSNLAREIGAAPPQGGCGRSSWAWSLYLVLVGPWATPAAAELALLCWLSGAAFILLVETTEATRSEAGAALRRRPDRPGGTAFDSPPERP